tara:strand:- start:642 stop:1181 length:540 start_codon:yes stop_codon:yes gene_type:complete
MDLMPVVTMISSASPTSGKGPTFSSIPSTYEDLLVIGSMKNDRTAGSGTIVNRLEVRMNGDTGSNYMYGYWGPQQGSLLAEYQNGWNAMMMIGSSSSASSNTGWGSFWVYIPGYKNTTEYKSVQVIAAFSQGPSLLEAAVTGKGCWKSNAAINELSFETAYGTNVVAGTNLVLYGISNS